MTATWPAAPRLAVFGASGPLGSAVLEQCSARGWPVVALSRAAQSASAGVDWRLARLPDAVPPLPVVDAILSLGPLDLFSAWLAHVTLPGRPRVIAVSSMSAVVKAKSPHAGERGLAARLLHAEAQLAAACDAAGCAWTVLRPTLLYGRGRDRNVSRVLRFAAHWRVMPLPQACGLRQPLHVDDLAAALLSALMVPATHAQVLSIGGGERLTVAEMFTRLYRVLPVRALPVPIPAWVARAARIIASRSHGAAALARCRDDLVADNDQVERWLKVVPRGFQPIFPDPSQRHTAP